MVNVFRRQSTRLKGFDYSEAGYYFITICTKDRECLFGEVVHGRVRLNDAGRMIERAWKELFGHYSSVETDEFVVMPNHIHGIVIITNSNLDVGAPLVGALNPPPECPNRAGTRPAPTLGDVIRVFKSKSTVEYIRGVRQKGWDPFPCQLWQRNYYEHIIRNEDELFETRQYIQENPLKWDLDPENPQRLETIKS